MDHPVEQSFQEPTDKKTRAGYGKFLRPNTPYDNFMESQGIPIYRDIGVRRVQDLPRKPWKRMGGSGTFIQLLGTEGLWGCYVVEVPGAGALNPEKHLYEEQYLVVDGRGTTEVWVDGNPKKVTFEWQKGSIFAIPMNATHRIVNATSSPALLLAGTTAPNIMNNFGNEEFIFNCPYNFADRYTGAEGFFNQGQKRYESGMQHIWETNFITDIQSATIDKREVKGKFLLRYLVGSDDQWVDVEIRCGNDSTFKQRFSPVPTTVMKPLRASMP